MKLIPVLLFSFLVTLIQAESTTHTYWFNAEWVTANPDGCFERQMIGYNGTWPWPTLRVKKGDRIQMYLTNGLGNQNTSMHFHGLFQRGTNQMDGGDEITQCTIPPGATYLYNFTINGNVGSYW